MGRKKLGGGKKFARLFRIVPELSKKFSGETFQNCCRRGGGNNYEKFLLDSIFPTKLTEFPTKLTELVPFRESTFIMPRGGDEDVLKKAHIFTGPLLRLLVNFRCPPSKFLKFSMPPLQNLELKEYNPEFSLIIDTICSSSRCPTGA